MRLLPTLLVALVPLVAGCAAQNGSFCDEATPCSDGELCAADLHECVPVLDAAPDAGPTGPTVDATPPDAPKIAQLETEVFDERADLVTLIGTPQARQFRHSHRASADQPLMAIEPETCAKVFKHPHLLDRAPVAQEDQPNPLRIAFELTDPTGIVVDAIAYRVKHPASGFVGPWHDDPAEVTTRPSAAGAKVEIALHRDATPELGQHDGSFEIELKAANPAGLESTAQACIDLERLPAPLAFEAPIQPEGPRMTRLTLAGDDAALTALLNDSGGAPIVTVAFQNNLPEDVIVRLGQVAELESCARSYRRQAALVEITPINTTCSSDSAACLQDKPADLFILNAQACATPPTTSIEVTDDATGAALASCQDCAADEFLIPAATGAPRKYHATVSLTGLSGMRPFRAGETARVAGDYILTYFPFIGAAPATSQRLVGRASESHFRCLHFATTEPARCIQRAGYRIYRAVTGIDLRYNSVGVTAERRLPDSDAFGPADLATIPVTWATTEAGTLPPTAVP